MSKLSIAAQIRYLSFFPPKEHGQSSLVVREQTLVCSRPSISVSKVDRSLSPTTELPRELPPPLLTKY